MINESEKSAGGIYLFEDEASLKSHLESDLYARLKSHPAFSDVETKVFDILIEHSKITRAPI